MRFSEILDQYNVSYASEGKHTRRGWLQLDCPMCGGHLYLGYNVAHHYGNCWRCGPLNPIDFLSRLTGESYSTIKALLVALERDPSASRVARAITRGKLICPNSLGELEPPHIRYLSRRYFDSRELERLWGIKGIGIAANLAWRIWIPIVHRAEIVSWTTRSISDKVEARYLSASAEQEVYNHKTLLYGEDYARHTILVVEGPFDVWRIGPGAVATLGTGFSGAQLEKMTHYPNRVVCFDNEPKAQARARRLTDELALFKGTTYNVKLSAKDPASATEEEINQLRAFLR